MAKYTTELGKLIESGFNIFDFNYNFYDDSKKEQFQQDFINHFYFYEIGQETPFRFKHYLKVKFTEVLPKYNKIFETALIEYEKTKNYNMVETFERTLNKINSVNGNIQGNGETDLKSNGTNTLERDVDIDNTSDRNSTLESKTDHTEENKFDRTQTLTDKSTNTSNNAKDSNLLNVESDTPQNLLTVNDIKTNVYASKANRGDNTETITSSESLDNTKTDTNHEITTRTSKDEVGGSTHETGTDSSNQKVEETGSNNTHDTGIYSNATTTAQEESGNETENTTRTFSGSYGVITESDMLKKHIELQEILTTAEMKFFDECQDLFMMIF